MKLRKRLYDKAKRTGNYNDWCDYKQARNEVNTLLETAHRNHCASLFNDSSSSKKKGFGHTLRQKRKITLGLRMEKTFVLMQNIKLVP